MRTPLLSVKELAAELGVSAHTVRRAVLRGDIPSWRIGRLWRFDPDAVCKAVQREVQVWRRTRLGTRASRDKPMAWSLLLLHPATDCPRRRKEQKRRIAGSPYWDKKRFTKDESRFTRGILEPATGIEPATCGLRNRCSTN